MQHHTWTMMPCQDTKCCIAGVKLYVCRFNVKSASIGSNREVRPLPHWTKNSFYTETVTVHNQHNHQRWWVLTMWLFACRIFAILAYMSCSCLWKVKGGKLSSLWSQFCEHFCERNIFTKAISTPFILIHFSIDLRHHPDV